MFDSNNCSWQERLNSLRSHSLHIWIDLGHWSRSSKPQRLTPRSLLSSQHALASLEQRPRLKRRPRVENPVAMQLMKVQMHLRRNSQAERGSVAKFPRTRSSNPKTWGSTAGDIFLTRKFSIANSTAIVSKFNSHSCVYIWCSCDSMAFGISFLGFQHVENHMWCYMHMLAPTDSLWCLEWCILKISDS